MKLLMVGSGPEWEKAPFEDESFEVWTYGLIADVVPRVSAVFELHQREQWQNFHWKTSPDEYVAKLNGLGKPIFMCKEHADIPESIEYPLAAVEQLVGPHFASTVSYQLALACLRQKESHDVDEVALYGFDLHHFEEWAYQRPNVNRLIGFAQGLGIKVSTPANPSLIGIPWKYGYELPEKNLHVCQALIEEDMAQLAAVTHRIGEHQVDMAIARRNGGQHV